MKVSINYSGFDGRYFVTAKDLAGKELAGQAEREALQGRMRTLNRTIAERICAHHDRMEGLKASITSAKKSIEIGSSGKLGYCLAEKRLSELKRYILELEVARSSECRRCEEDVSRVARELRLEERLGGGSWSQLE